MEENKTLSESAASKLTDYIVKNGFEKGQKLPNEKDLCKILNVGRSTMREAVRMLASRNILFVKHGSGIYLTDNPGISDDPFGFIFIKDKPKLIEDLIDFRMMIEPRMASLACNNVKDSDIEELEQLSYEVEVRIKNNENHYKEDAKFHEKICSLSGNSIFPKIEPIILKSINIFIGITESTLKDETIEDHRRIVEAIKAHNAVAASDAMVLHLIRNRAYIQSILHKDKSKDASK